MLRGHLGMPRVDTGSSIFCVELEGRALVPNMSSYLSKSVRIGGATLGLAFPIGAQEPATMRILPAIRGKVPRALSSTYKLAH